MAAGISEAIGNPISSGVQGGGGLGIDPASTATSDIFGRYVGNFAGEAVSQGVTALLYNDRKLNWGSVATAAIGPTINQTRQAYTLQNLPVPKVPVIYRPTAGVRPRRPDEFGYEGIYASDQTNPFNGVGPLVDFANGPLPYATHGSDFLIGEDRLGQSINLGNTNNLLNIDNQQSSSNEYDGSFTDEFGNPLIVENLRNQGYQSIKPGTFVDINTRVTGVVNVYDDYGNIKSSEMLLEKTNDLLINGNEAIIAAGRDMQEKIIASMVWDSTPVEYGDIFGFKVKLGLSENGGGNKVKLSLDDNLDLGAYYGNGNAGISSDGKFDYKVNGNGFRVGVNDYRRIDIGTGVFNIYGDSESNIGLAIGLPNRYEVQTPLGRINGGLELFMNMENAALSVPAVNDSAVGIRNLSNQLELLNQYNDIESEIQSLIQENELLRRDN